jgi:RNA polymerase sigma-70 factor (ECF subfamily)
MQICEAKSELSFLSDAIRSLPPKCQAVFVMHRLEGVPHTEIASRLGITVSAVEKHIASAMLKLRMKLNYDGA